MTKKFFTQQKKIKTDTGYFVEVFSQSSLVKTINFLDFTKNYKKIEEVEQDDLTESEKKIFKLEHPTGKGKKEEVFLDMEYLALAVADGSDFGSLNQYLNTDLFLKPYIDNLKLITDIYNKLKQEEKDLFNEYNNLKNIYNVLYPFYQDYIEIIKNRNILIQSFNNLIQFLVNFLGVSVKDLKNIIQNRDKLKKEYKDLIQFLLDYLINLGGAAKLDFDNIKKKLKDLEKKYNDLIQKLKNKLSS